VTRGLGWTLGLITLGEGNVELAVVREDQGHRLRGEGSLTEVANRFLTHLQARGFAAGTVRGYAYDLLNFFRFLSERRLELTGVVPTDLFDWLEWQATSPEHPSGKVVRLTQARGVAPATMNRRVAAVRGLFEFAVITGLRADSPVPAARRSTGLRARPRGLLGHVKPRSPRADGGRLVRQPQRLPDSLELDDVNAFLVDLDLHRDRAMVLVMLLGGLRAAEVRGLRLADVDFGLRQLRVVGKGGRERVVPVDRPFFVELTAYLRDERPGGLSTEECFVVLRGPTQGRPLTEAGMRRMFRTHRERSGATRVRPHRLRHTYGTELAAAGIDLLVLQALMGHANPETTSAYVHLTAATLAAEYARAREGSP
jgi:integrase/recombinase XerC